MNIFTLDNNYKINGTNKHRVLAFKNGTVDLHPLSSLEIGDYILFPRTAIGQHWGGNNTEYWKAQGEQFRSQLKPHRWDLHDLPEKVFSCSIAERWAFVCGLVGIESQQSSFSIKVKSKKLAHSIQELLLTLGVISSVTYQKYWNKVDVGKKTMNSLSLDSETSKKLSDEIMEVNPRSRKHHSNPSHLDYFLRRLRHFNQITESQLSICTVNGIVLPDNLKQLIGKEFLRIKEKRTVISDVYDLTVPETHEFYAQGTFNHNTTLARLFAKAINCENSQNSNPCGKCDNCLTPLETAPYYEEYDATIVGNIDKIRELRDTFYYKPSNAKKVIVLDEIHQASSQAQTAFLKVIEDSEPGIFFIFCTTHVKKIIPTILSRSLTLTFNLISAEDMKNNLKSISERMGLVPPKEEILDNIVKKSQGHMRNAHMLLDYFYLLGEEGFSESVSFPTTALSKFYISMVKRSDKEVFESLQELLKYPLADIQYAYTQYQSLLARAFIGQVHKDVEEVVKIYGNNLLKLVKINISDWIIEAFKDEYSLECALLCQYQLLFKNTSSQTTPQNQNNGVAK